MSLKNKAQGTGNTLVVHVPFKGQVLPLVITAAQFEIIEAAGVEVIGIFTYGGKQVARGRGMLDGKKVQPMIHKLLGFDITTMTDYMDFTVAPVVDDPYDIPEPVVEVTPPKTQKAKAVSKIYEEDINSCSEYPIRGVSWNKRKNKYEAKATHKATKRRQFLGYYKPEDVHVANTAVRDFIAEGPDVYDEIMERYYVLYPNKRR